MGKRILTGQAQPSDALLLLYLLHLKTPTPVEKAPAPAEKTTTPKEESAPVKEETKPQEEVAAPKEQQPAQSENTNNKKGDAFESPEPITSKAKGDIGEAKVIEELAGDGYTETVSVQNNSGHGVDVIARNPTNGNVKCVEVKANTSKLSEAQSEGGQKFVEDRLNRAANEAKYYKSPPNPPELKAKAEKASDWIKDAPQVDYEVRRVEVDNTTGEVIGDSKIDPWEPKPKK